MSESRPVFLANLGESEVTEWCGMFFDAVSQSDRLYRGADGSLTMIDQVVGPRRILSPVEFYGSIPNYVDVHRRIEDRDGNGREVPTIMRRDQTDILYNSDEAIRLKQIKAVVKEPVVVNCLEKPRVISKPGYDREAQIYYHVPAGEAPIEVLHTTEHLERCFSAVPFEHVEYRNNIFAWLLSSVCMDKRLDAPLLTVTGNDRGVGKSTLVQACGSVLTGELPAPIQPRGAEFEKQVGSRFAEHQRFILMDNIVTQGNASFKNANLARMLTQGWSKKVRILGQSRSVQQTGVLLALTMNDCKLDADLATRSLPVRLYRERPAPQVPFCRDYADKYRREIYGELLGLALTQGAARSETEVSPHFRFRAWLEFVGPRIEAAFGKLGLKQAEQLDDRLQELYAWGVDHVQEPFSANELLTKLRASEDRYPDLIMHIRTGSGDRGQKHKLAAFLKNAVGGTMQMQPDLFISLRIVETNPREGNKYVFKETTS